MTKFHYETPCNCPFLPLYHCTRLCLCLCSPKYQKRSPQLLVHFVPRIEGCFREKAVHAVLTTGLSSGGEGRKNTSIFLSLCPLHLGAQLSALFLLAVHVFVIVCGSQSSAQLTSDSLCWVLHCMCALFSTVQNHQGAVQTTAKTGCERSGADAAFCLKGPRPASALHPA